MLLKDIYINSHFGSGYRYLKYFLNLHIIGSLTILGVYIYIYFNTESHLVLAGNDLHG